MEAVPHVEGARRLFDELAVIDLDPNANIRVVRSSSVPLFPGGDGVGRKTIAVHVRRDIGVVGGHGSNQREGELSATITADMDCDRLVTYTSPPGHGLMKSERTRVGHDGDHQTAFGRLPDENAFDLLPRIKKLRPELPIIVMSAQNTFMTAIKASERGAYEYLPKPFDLKELVAVVGRALSRPAVGADRRQPRRRTRISRSSAARRRCRRSTALSPASCRPI